MSYKKLFSIIIFLISLGFLFNLNSFSARAQTTEQLQALIAQLQEQINELQGRLSSELSESEPIKSESIKQVPGEIIIKLKQGAAQRLDNKLSPQALSLYSAAGSINTGTASLSELNKKYEVFSMEPAFKDLKKEQLKTGKDYSTLFNETKQKYPERAKRVENEDITIPNLLNIYKLTFSQDTNVLEVIEDYQNNPSVEYAEPNYLAKTTFVPNDTLYSQQWAHQNTQAEQGWDIEKGNREIIIAIIDSGVDYLHEDLFNNMLGDCTNGCPEGTGYDFTDTDSSYCHPQEDCKTPDNKPSDFFGHGTHCAGIAAAVSNNNKGIAGVCQNCKIMPLRAGWTIATGEGTLEYDDVVQALHYAADNGADVVSMSFGGEEDSSIMKDALDYTYSAGVVLVAAAGNSNSNAKEYPAGYENVIAVAATAQDDTKARYSSYGDWVDIAAPGGDSTKDSMILSTVPKTGVLSDPSGYRSLQGTSMACPYVAGLSGLILSRNPNWSNGKVKQVLEEGVDTFGIDIPDPGYHIGAGRVNVYRALQICPTCTQLFVSLQAIPSSGVAPLNGVDLKATVSGSATGAINYKFDCQNDGTWEKEVNSSNENPYTAIDICSYPNAGTYTAKVLVERQGLSAQNTRTITVSSLNTLSVSTNNASNIEETTATLNGEITDTGEGDARERGFDWKISGDYDSSSWTETGSFGTGLFNREITGLFRGTGFSFRAKARNQGGWGYGEYKTSYTKPGDPSGLTATPKSQTQIFIAWNKGGGADKTKILMKTGEYPSSRNDSSANQVFFDTNISADISGLTCGTTYYYRAWAYDTESGYYSDGYAQTSATTNGCPGTQLYEYYNTGDNDITSIHGVYWKAQTFTPATAHKITSVKLKVFRQGSPGTVTVSIRATDASGHPTGSDLCSGTTDGNTLTDSGLGEWREITLGAGCNLAANTKYAVVVRISGGDASSRVYWRCDTSSPTYAGGNYEASSYSGSVWTGNTSYDFMFEEWGEPSGPVLPTVDFKANNSDGPITIGYNTPATLSWTSTNATSCTASNAWSGTKSLSGSESTGNLTSSKTYTLTCSGPGGSVSDSVTVNVTACTNTVPSVSTLSSPANGATGQSTSPTVSWNAVSSWGTNCAGNTNTYEVFLDTNSNPTTSRGAVAAGTTTKALSGLSNNTTYYWKVRASNGALSTDSAIPNWSFTTSPEQTHDGKYYDIARTPKSECQEWFNDIGQTQYYSLDTWDKNYNRYDWWCTKWDAISNQWVAYGGSNDACSYTMPDHSSYYHIGCTAYGKLSVPNQAPSITSASDSPDPIVSGNPITFTVNWSDPNSGDQTKIHICKTNAMSGQICSGGSWCDTTAWSSTSPTNCNYTTQAADAGTKTYYAFVCDDDNACSSSAAGSFTVQTQVNAPSVSTNNATNLEETTATLNGEITNAGGENCDQRGFDWGLTTSYGSSWTETGTYGTGTFSRGITGLSMGTLYHFRAKAHNSSGWGYGTDKTFYTKPGDPSGLTASPYSQTQINLSWLKGAGSDKTKVLRKQGTYPTSYSDGTQVYFDTGTSASDTGLTCSTTYYYRSWAYDSESSYYSDGYTQASATTNDCSNHDGKYYDIARTPKDECLKWFNDVGNTEYYSLDTWGNSQYDWHCTKWDSINNTWIPYGGYKDECWYNLPVHVSYSHIGCTAYGKLLTPVPTLSVDLEAIPSSGQVPLNDVDLKATVSGTATGTINYKFDCQNDGIWDSAVNATNTNPYTTLDLCDYPNVGTYTAKVKVERGTLSAEDTVAISVSSGITLPSVSTNDATLTEETTVTLNGNITNTGGENANERGFDWGLTTSYGSSWTEAGTYGTGTFNRGITGLSMGTLYHFQAKAHNSSGWGNGTDKSFYTKPGDPSNLTATSYSQTQINLSWTKGAGADKTKLLRKTGSYPTSYSDGTQVYFDTGTSVSDTGLTCGTVYYYRAWAYDSESGYYSDGYSQTNATTSACTDVPTVQTNDASSITQTQATFNGNLTNLGGANSCNVWFQWGATTSYGNETTHQTKTSTGTFSATITGLSSNTTYHFRAVAENTAGISYGQDKTFITPPEQTHDGKYYDIARTPKDECLKWFNDVGNTEYYSLDTWGNSQYDWHCTKWDSINNTWIPYGGYKDECWYNLPVHVSYSHIGCTAYGKLSSSTLFVDLEAIPFSGVASLNDVDLKATVSGTATGTINYKFDCQNDGIWDSAVNATITNPYTVLDLCDYPNVGNYIAKVKVERQTLSAEDTITISVSQGITLPSVSTNDSTNVSQTSATLNGNLTNLGGANSVNIWFQWGTTTSYGNETSHQTKTSTGTFSDNLTNLTPNTPYHFRAVAENSAGKSYGADKTFTTLPSEVTITWVSPTGYVPLVTYGGEEKIYDDNLSTHTSTGSNWNNTWCPFLELTHESIPVSKVRYYLIYDKYYNNIDVDVFYNNSWHDVYEGGFSKNTWIEKDVPEGTQQVSSARIRLHTNGNYACFMTEFDFGKVEGTSTLPLNFAEILENIRNQIASMSEKIYELLK